MQNRIATRPPEGGLHDRPARPRLPGGVSPAPAAAQAFGGAILVADGRILVGEAGHQREPGTVRAYAWMAEPGAGSQPCRAPALRCGTPSANPWPVRATFLFVGAGRGSEGRVHVYRLADMGTPEAAPVETLTLSGRNGFGEALVASGTELVAAATNPGVERTLVTFRRGTDGMWSHTETLAVGQGSGFGAGSFAMSGDLLAVRNPASGTVDVYERESGEEWGASVALERPGSAGEQVLFGISIAVYDKEILVGEMRVGRDGAGGIIRTGAVHRFAKVDGAWSAIGMLSPEDGQSQDGYGSSLTVHGSTLLAGGGGQVFAYTREDDAWTLTGTSRFSGAEDEGPPLSFQTVALGDGIVALGDPAADFGMGAVSVLTSGDGEWVHIARLVADHTPLPAVTGGEVACDDGEAADYDCDHVDLLSFLPREELGGGRGARLNDVWGWTDPETGREYGLVGRMDGTAFVDVTDPYNPRYLGNLATTEGSRANTWRDVKVFKHHAFVVADGAGAHGMQVFGPHSPPGRDRAARVLRDGPLHRYRIGPQRSHQRGDRLRVSGGFVERGRDLRGRVTHRGHQRPPQSGLRGLLRPPQHGKTQYRQLARRPVRHLPRPGRGPPGP